MKTRNFILSFLMMMFCSVAFGQNAYDWGELNYHNYSNSQQVYAVVKLDGVLNNSQDFEIAPFCGDQLRGDAARPIYYGDKYGYMFTFSVFGNVGDVITFRLYDYATETLYDNVSITKITWTINPWGMMSSPKDIAFNSVAEVAGVKYGSLAKAVEKATTGATVKVINDVTLSEGIVISKKLTLDLNGNEITTNGDFYPVIRVQDDAEVTVTGEGSIEHNDYVFVLGSKDEASVGNLTIENGTFHGATTVANVTKGNLVIEGGEFSVEPYQGNYAYLINCVDANFNNETATVAIKGGTFHNWNPEDNAAEGAGTNFCPQTPVKYIAVENPAGVFTVQEGTWVAQIGNVKYQSLQAAFEAAQNGETITMLADIELATSITNVKNVTLDLNGKTITGTDNATASFALIEVQPEKELTVKGNGVITLTSVNNRGWNAYSSVISNQRGKLVVDGATIEHLGGTDMAYAIDNLTNTGAQIAETVINGGTIKSTYRAIRQFLNSSAQGVNNILTVNGGTIEGANKSIWMQDANAKANPGKLTVSENASLKGDVYLTVTAGSTEWPVEVMVKAAALKDGANVLPNNNVPAKYEVKLVYDYYTVVEIAPVAKIGETLYYSLQAAFEAATDGQTVVMLRDVTEEFAVDNDANVAFDMNGNTLNGAILPSTANLTINGGTITNIDKSHSAIEINAGSLVLNDVNVSSARHAVRVDGNGVNVTINGGTYSVKVTEGASSTMTRHAIYVGGNASDKAVVTIKDGEFIGPKGSPSDSGAAINVKAGSEVYVEGGQFSGGKTKTLDSKGILSLTGGIYDQDVQQYCADGYMSKDQGDGTYLVRRKPAGHVAYRADVTDKDDREGIAILLKEVFALESVVVKVYNGETLMFTCTRRDIDDEGKVMFPVDGNTTANIVLCGKESGSWINEIHVAPTELNVPDKIEVYADGTLVDSYTHESGTVLGTNLEKYLALDCVKKAVAQVGETKYISLKDAINACTNGETVTIIRDVTYTSEDVVNAIGGATGFGQYPNPCIVDIGGQEGENGAANIPSYVNAIVDLNGHTLTNNAEAYFFIIMDNAKVVFTDSSADKTGKVITNVDAPAVWVVGTETLVTIEDGYFQTASAGGVLHSTHGGDLVIAGGEFKTTAERTNLLIMLNSKDRQNSANFIKGVATVSIKGGIFHGFNPSMVGDDNGATSIENIRFVNGCADGYAPIMIDENTYGVIPAVAMIGEKYYATLAEAVVAAQAGETVTVLRDATGAGVVINKNVTIDFADFTYSLNEPVGSSNTVSNGLQILAGNNVTLMNGTLKVADDAANKFYILVQNYANLTVEGMILEGENLDKYSFTDGDSYVLSNNSGNVNIINTTIKANSDGDLAFAFDVCDSESYTVKPVVYVKGNDTRVEGRIEVSATIEENLHIQGGTYDFDVEEAGYCDNAYFTKDNGNDTWTVEGPYVAQIGETRYATLAAAVSAATAGQTITLIADVTENVTIQKDLTIDGAGKNYTGNIAAKGSAVDLIVKNVNFINGTNYAITTNTIKSITVENCTVNNYNYGFLYSNKSTTTIAVKDVTVDGCNYGMHWVYGSKATLENVTMTNVAYGLYIQNYASKTITVKNSNISSIAIWERDGYSGVQTFKFEGENKVGTLDNSQYAKYVLVNENATLEAEADRNVVSGDDDYVVAYEGGIYKLVPASVWNKTQDKKYGTLQAAINAAESDDEIVLLANINLDETALGLLDNQYSTYFKVEGKTVTIDLNGMEITGTFNATPMLVGMFSTENNGHLTLVDNSTEKDALVELTSGNDQVYALIANYEGGSSITINGGTYKLNKAIDSHMYTGGDEGIIVNGGNFHLGNVGAGQNGKPWIFNALGQNANCVVVNGGTFNADVNHQFWANEVYVPETKALQNNGNGTWTVVDAVAYVEEKATSTGATPRQVGYASLADAVKANGTTVTVIKEHETTATAVVEKDMTIDFDGLAITGDVYPVVRIQNNANVTVKNGNITNGDYVFVLGSSDKATAGNLTIENGSYTGVVSVASVTKGNLVIKDGEFKLQDVNQYGYTYMINCIDANYNNGTATVAISGGTFYGFNPENNAAEGAGKNFCAAGYGAVETDSNIWTVVPKQSQTLAAGWNWYSSYIEANNLLAQLKEGLGANGVEIKNHLGQFTDYNEADGKWYGSLNSISVSEMYMIENVNDANIAVLGNIVDPSKPENAIAIKSEWNWIGYPMTEELSVSQALNGLTANDGDIIKSHNGAFSTYVEGYGWTSGLNKMEPCKGYMYYSYAETAKKFNYSYPRSKEAVESNVTPANNYWVPNTSAFAGNMSVMAVLNVDGSEMKEGFEVAAFVNGEVRGSARPTYVEAIDRYVLFLSVCGENGEEVTFKYVDMYSEEEYTIDNKVVYEDNAIIGSVRDLYVLTLNTMGIGENGYSTISLYPNPTTTNTAISFETVCDMVEVFNSLGAKVAEYSNVDRIDGMEAAGVYVIRVTNEGSVQNCRLIVK